MNELLEFSLDTENAEKNYNLAKWYEEQGHTAPALTYYTRASERTENKKLAYVALLRGYYCYNSQGSRDNSAKILLQNAVAFYPKRPEAYFLLSQFYEKQENWQESYIYACIGLENCDHNLPDLIDDVGYPGKYGLIFQKAMCGYWWGKGQEARILFQDLINNYQMEKTYYDLVVSNITRLGSGSDAAVKKIDDYMLELCEDKHSIKRKIEKIYPDYDQRYGGWGWCTLNKAGCLIDYVNEICESTKNPVCVEIGVYAGKSILPVALELQRNKKGIVYAIDPWSNESATEGYDGDNLIYWQNINLGLYLNIFKESIKEFNLENYVSIIQSTSNDAPDISNINLLYIDGQHTIQALKDAEKYATQVELNGYCVVDDVNWGEVSEVPEYLKSIGFEFVNSVDVAQVFKRVRLQSTNIIKTYTNTSWIVDNFYDDPDSIREFALKQEYIEGGIGRGFIGRRTEQQFLFPDLKAKFEEIMGRKITAWQEHGMNGRFQISWSGQPLVYHCDSQKWGGMLYLTPNAPYQCGTTLYAHKQTKARTYHEEGWDAAWKDVPGDCHLDGTSFEPVDVLGNVYNRLVIFDASAIHAASEYFGTVKENARLWQMFFFDTL